MPSGLRLLLLPVCPTTHNSGRAVTGAALQYVFGEHIPLFGPKKERPSPATEDCWCYIEDVCSAAAEEMPSVATQTCSSVDLLCCYRISAVAATEMQFCCNVLAPESGWHGSPWAHIASEPSTTPPGSLLNTLRSPMTPFC